MADSEPASHRTAQQLVSARDTCCCIFVNMANSIPPLPPTLYEDPPNSWYDLVTPKM